MPKRAIWLRISRIPPPAIPIVDGFALTITKPSAGNVLVAWADQGVSTYEVWTSDDPYFQPGDAGSTMVASGSGLSYATTDGTETYYRVFADGATTELSTTVAQLSYDLYIGYTKLGLCLVSEIDEWDELQADMPSGPSSASMWDTVAQGWIYDHLLEDVTFGPGEVISVLHGDTPSPDSYTAIGHVPTSPDVAITLLPGDNLVTTIPLRFGPILASDLLDEVEHATRIGMWDAPNQTTIWYPDDSDFLLPTCSPVHVEVSATSSWPPPEPASELPPDPASVAPALDTTVTTRMYDAVSFLFEGDPPIQEGVDPGTIQPARISVLRGFVGERGGDPLGGVLVTVLGHPEYGSTLTREDGRYDLAVNGGAPVTLAFELQDMLPAQRTTRAAWQSYTEVDGVALVALDTEVSVIDFSDPIEVHVASAVTDVDGPRTSVLMFEEGTIATMIMPDTSEDELTSISVRATEYTVGAEGPAAMPGDLPVASMYTYAVAYTVDEAEAAGAERVTFDPPAISYTTNFVGFPVGQVVPSGYYDPERAAWMPQQNGRVLEVVGETSGMADLDLDGDGTADPGDYAAEGIGDDEREAVADQYDIGDELWRVPVEHFSSWDYNWGWCPPAGAEPPPPQGPQNPQPDANSCEEPGSILECQGQVMGERVHVSGTPFTLNYRSDRVPGRAASYTLTLPTTGSSLPFGLEGVRVRTLVAGQLIAEDLAVAVDEDYSVIWNGLDAYGRRVQGPAPAQICLGYANGIAYHEMGSSGSSTSSAFGYNGNGSIITGDRDGGGGATFWRCYAAGAVGGGMVPTSSGAAQTALGWNDAFALGTWDARAGSPALGGWTIDVHHTLAPEAGVLYLGDGRRRTNADTFNAVAGTIAGGGASTAMDILATEASLAAPQDVAAGADGSIYVAVSGRVRRIDSNGMIRAFAGTGTSGCSGDDGPATSAQLVGPLELAVGPDGSVYIADWGCYRIRRVDTSGVIDTVAGDGTNTLSGDGGPATSAGISRPYGVAVAPDGTIFIASATRIRRVSPDGTISTFAGGTCTSGSPDGKVATGDCFL